MSNLDTPPVADEKPAEGDPVVIGHRDFAHMVADAQREAMAQPNFCGRRIASQLSDDVRPSGVPASFASFPNCKKRAGGRSNDCPPRSYAPQQGDTSVRDDGSPMPGTTPSPGMPSAPRAAPSDALQADVVPPLPNIRENLPPLDRQARSDVGRRSAGTTYSDAPWLVGDGCGPQGSAAQTSIGRLMIDVQGLSGTGSVFTTPNSGQLNLVKDPTYNRVQGIPNSGTFTLPAVPLGAVPGPITLTTNGALPGTTIPAVQNPGGAFQTAAQNAFQTNPSLSRTNGVDGTAVYDPATSGLLTGASGSAAYLYYNYAVDSALILPGYAVGFVKLTENMSPIPRDRVYMNYSYFRNANFFGERADVNRFMPGFEKTFFDGWTSIELRTPFAATLDNFQTIQTSGGTGMTQLSEARDIQFGNMSVIFKTLVWEDKTWAITGGIQMMLPTASNTKVYGPSTAYDLSGVIQQVFVANESVHAMPFVAGIWAPNERFFNQALLQIDRDCNGNLAYVNNNQDPSLRGRQLQQAGRLWYPTFMYMSFGTGYWLYKDNKANFTGFSPILEVHVNQALEDFQPLCVPGYTLGTNPGVISVVNGLIGCNFEWGVRSTLTFAYVTPLGGGVDRFFDGELRALYNFRFGPQNRLTRAQF
jgi:hypothetical protein